MGLIADLVREIVSFLGYDMPWRKVNLIISRLLLLIAFLFPGALIAGLLMYAHDQQCAMENTLASTL
jgi:hypothetical protein